MDSADRFTYCFSVWPCETWGFDPAIFQLFEMMGGRLEIPFCEPEFERFRSALSHHGLSLREIERVPYCDPEPVM